MRWRDGVDCQREELRGHSNMSDKNRARRAHAALFLVTSCLLAFDAGASTCSDLTALKLNNVVIDRAEPVAAGKVELPSVAGLPGPARPLEVPAFCRVAATLKPTPASDIKIEVWLPQSGWNRKLLAVGNGGWSGGIFLYSMAPGLQRGYAVTGTDTGHVGLPGDGSFAYRQPEKLVDFGWRAVHEMTVTAKAIVDAFYTEQLARSYWQGCSSGGKQGLKEAQRFPEDFDGIVAGAPASPWTRLTASSLSAGLAALPRDSAKLLPPDKLKLLNGAAVHTCDAQDGVNDGVIEDPRVCTFDPAAVVCEDAAKCLTREQAEAARKIYAPLRNPNTKKILFAGFSPGSEISWSFLLAGPKPLNIAHDHFRFVVFDNPDWDPWTFDVARDVARAEDIDAKGGQLNASDPNLDAFRKRGGKLLMYHGWGDGAIPAQNSIDYFEAVLARDRSAAREAGLTKLQQDVRLFMVPGLGHCMGGTGATQFDPLTALERWVEQGLAPESIEARGTSRDTALSRKLCPYPLVAQYDGRGDPNQSESFNCK
jgi:feruloyl esterase